MLKRASNPGFRATPFLQFLFFFLSGVSGQCTVACVNGNCESDPTFCSCSLFYSGVSCDISWRDDPAWMDGFFTFAYLSLSAFSILLLLVLRQLWIHLFYSKKAGWKRWSIIPQVEILMELGILARVLEFAIDPYSVRGIVPQPIDEFIYNFAYVVWFMGLFMMFLYWLELQQQTGIISLFQIKKYRPAILIFVTGVAVIIIPTALWRAITFNDLSNDITNAALGLVAISLIVFASWQAVKLHRHFEQYANFTSLPVRIFIRKATNLVVVVDLVLVTAVIALAYFTFVDKRTNRWTYIGFHTIFRVQECAILLGMFYLLGKKAPKELKPEESETTPK